MFSFMLTSKFYFSNVLLLRLVCLEISVLNSVDDTDKSKKKKKSKVNNSKTYKSRPRFQVS